MSTDNRLSGLGSGRSIKQNSVIPSVAHLERKQPRLQPYWISRNRSTQDCSLGATGEIPELFACSHPKWPLRSHPAATRRREARQTGPRLARRTALWELDEGGSDLPLHSHGKLALLDGWLPGSESRSCQSLPHCTALHPSSFQTSASSDSLPFVVYQPQGASNITLDDRSTFTLVRAPQLLSLPPPAFRFLVPPTCPPARFRPAVVPYRASVHLRAIAFVDFNTTPAQGCDVIHDFVSPPFNDHILFYNPSQALTGPV
ncbi:hypothetical protein MRS44_012627 [Fusarium solani]|uniref:uncharacterized protein n=1 Tax=Fusarium solani TaxID=169388 RepID=UPI0032C462A8|nr:hypothetical protein MRS44_012627 [Fusarium solani]